MVFLTSKVFTGLTNHALKVVHATSGSVEGSPVYYYGSGTVNASGVLILPTATAGADFGLDFTLEMTTLPIDATLENNQLAALPRKIGKSVVELSETYNMQVNSSDVIFAETTLNTSNGLTSFTGRKEVYILGYSLEPIVTITQTTPLPMRVLGITTEIFY